MTSSLRIVALTAIAASAPCQEVEPPRAQPPRVDFGVVRVGAVAEGNLHVYWHRPKDDVRPEVEVPASMRQLELRTYDWGQGNARSTFGFALETAEVGAREIELTARDGDREVRVTVTWTVEPSQRGGSRVLLADSPFLGDSTDDPATFDAWRRLVEQARLDVDYRYSRRGAPAFSAAALQRVDVVVVGESSLAGITAQEVARLQGFVCGGGRAIVFANKFFGRTVQSANRICAPFELTFLPAEPPGNQRLEAIRDDIARHPLTVGLEVVSAHRPSPVTVGDTALAQSLVVMPALGEDRAFAAIATTTAKGELVAVGVSLWWLWIGRDAGNERLLRNLLVRAPRMR